MAGVTATGVEFCTCMYTYSLRCLVRNWLNGEKENYGVMAMVQESEDLTDALPSFAASSLRPSLEVRYFLPEEEADTETGG